MYRRSGASAMAFLLVVAACTQSSERDAGVANDTASAALTYPRPDSPATRTAVPETTSGGQESASPAAPTGETVVTGTVKWFNDSKGFGFLSRDDGGRDVFVHHAAIETPASRTLTTGQKVRFILVEGPKGPAASQVRVIQNEP
jgi:CspA family cold shock protein